MQMSDIYVSTPIMMHEIATNILNSIRFINWLQLAERLVRHFEVTHILFRNKFDRGMDIGQNLFDHSLLSLFYDTVRQQQHEDVSGGVFNLVPSLNLAVDYIDILDLFTIF